MRNIFIIFNLFLSVQFANAQSELDCGYYGKKTVEQRNKIFPFNKAKKVTLISYVNSVGKLQQEIKDTVALMKKFDAVKELQFSIYERNFFYLIKEEVSLNKDGIDRLSNIFINYTLKKKQATKGRPAGTLCSYDPHNAVLFYDENGVIIGCYEVCFDCEKNIFIPDPAQLNNASYCSEAKITEIKKLFDYYGIKYLGNSQ
jgi:hypothetical protein